MAHDGPPRRGFGGVLALLAVLIVAPAIATQPLRRLAEGDSIEVELGRGDVHRYEVDLAPGDYLGVVIDQQDIDVQPSILGPDGATLYDYDFGEYGQEPASAIAVLRGLHHLEVRTAPNAAPVGRYHLRVVARRPATTTDQSRARVMRLQMEGLQLVRGRARDLRRARPVYEQVLAEWEALGDRAGEAHALTALGFIASGLDDRAAEAQFRRRELAAYREIGHDYGEARAARNLAISLRAVGESTEAIALLERALTLHHSARRQGAEALVLADLANSSIDAGQFAKALELTDQAVTLARQLRDPLGEADGWATAARVHQALGQAEAARDAFRHALSLVPDTSTVRSDAARARAQIGVARALLDLGDLAAAAPLVEQALAVWTRLGFQAQIGQALTLSGELSLRNKEFQRARELFEQAARHAAEARYPPGELIARRYLGATLLALGQIGEAESTFMAAVGLLDRISNPHLRALLLTDQAHVALARSDFATARKLSDEALAITESARAWPQGPRIDASLLAASQRIYGTAIQAYMASHAADPAAGFQERALEASERARARSLLDMVLDSSAPSPVGHSTTLDELRAVQRRLNEKARALDQAQQGRNTTLVTALSRDVDELGAAFAVLDGRLRRENLAASSLVSPTPPTVADIQRDVIDQETVLVEYFLDEPHSYAWVVSVNGFASYRLAPRSRIEEATRGVATLAAAPRPGTRSGPPLAAGLALAELVLPPIRDVPPGRRLLIVAPGLLQNLPFAALPVDDQGREPLVARHELVYAPSAAVVSAMRRVASQRQPPPRLLAVFADPVFAPDDPRVAQAKRARSAAPAQSTAAQPEQTAQAKVASGVRANLGRLPFTRLEADRIAAIVPGGQVLKATGFEANLRTITSGSLADYRIVHFATHGVLNTRTPDLSGLVFSLVDENGRLQEGFLRLHDLDRLRLNADLAVLSGCDTGLGRRVEGEGTIGLTRGFIVAGARRVVASLWKVDDLATAELMQAFYTNLFSRKLPAPAALRAAQRQLAASRRWAHPYFWAGFVIQGEWQ